MTIGQLTFETFTQSSFYENAVHFLPKLAAAVLILIVGWVVATILSKLTRSLLVRIGVDKFHNANKAELPDGELFNKVKFSNVLSKFVYWGIVLAAFTAAVETLGLSRLSSIFDELLSYLPRLVSGLILLVIFLIVAGLLKSTLRKRLRGLGLNYANFIGGCVYWLLVVVGLSISLNHLQIETTLVGRIILVMVLSLCLMISIALGFSLREIATRILYGHYARDVFTAGSNIQVNGETVTILSVTSTTTIAETADGRKKYIPNSELMNNIYEE